MQYRRMAWTVEVLDVRVRGELEALPVDMRARFRRIVELIQGHGLERMREPHVKHIEGPLWEMPHEGQGRNLPGDLCHRERATQHEIDLALERAKEVIL